MNERAVLAFFVTVAAAIAAWWYVRSRQAPGAGGGGDFFSLLTGGGNEQAQTQAAPAAQQERPVSPAPQTLTERKPTWVTPLKGRIYDTVFAAAEAAYDLPAGLLSRVAKEESNYDSAARSPKGALGLMQFEPQTAQDFGIDPLDPWASIWAAGKYFKQLYDRFGDWKLAVAAYNWGAGHVAQRGLDAAPQETRTYYTQILGDIGLA